MAAFSYREYQAAGGRFPAAVFEERAPACTALLMGFLAPRRVEALDDAAQAAWRHALALQIDSGLGCPISRESAGEISVSYQGALCTRDGGVIAPAAAAVLRQAGLGHLWL